MPDLTCLQVHSRFVGQAAETETAFWHRYPGGTPSTPCRRWSAGGDCCVPSRCGSPPEWRAARRLLVDGSFVTAKEEPGDIDTVILLPEDCTQQLVRECEPAVELEEILLTRRPEEMFAAEDETDWGAWVNCLSRTREPDGRRKGRVAIR